MKFWRFLVGVLLMVIGIFCLAESCFDSLGIGWDKVWPLFIFILGALFELHFFLTFKNPWTLIPGGVMMTTGVIMFLEVFFNRWSHAEYTWPVYLLIPLSGLSQFYYFSGKNKRLLLPICILATLAVISGAISFLVFTASNRLALIILAVILIGAGLFIILKKPESRAGAPR